MAEFGVIRCGLKEFACGVYDTQSAALSDVIRYPVKNAEPKAIAAQFKAVCGVTLDRAVKAEGIFLAGSPYEFLFADATGAPLCNFMSGPQGEVFKPRFDGVSALDKMRAEIGVRFAEITGVCLNSASPAVNFVACAQPLALPRHCRLLSLPQWLTLNCGAFNGKVHESLAAGLGFYDIFEHAPAAELMDYAERICHSRPDCGEVCAEPVPCADFDGTAVYAPFNSVQCAVLGSGCRPADSVYISAGETGGVYAVAVRAPGADIMPYFDCMRLSASTGLPGFDAVARLLERFSAHNDLKVLLASANAQAAMETELEIPAHAFLTGSADGMAADAPAPEFTAAVLKSLAGIYAQAVRRTMPGGGLERCALGGELAVAAPVLREMLSRELGIEAEPAMENDVLLGLGKISETVSK